MVTAHSVVLMCGLPWPEAGAAVQGGGGRVMVGGEGEAGGEGGG